MQLFFSPLLFFEYQDKKETNFLWGLGYGFLTQLSTLLKESLNSDGQQNK